MFFCTFCNFLSFPSPSSSSSASALPLSVGNKLSCWHFLFAFLPREIPRTPLQFTMEIPHSILTISNNSMFSIFSIFTTISRKLWHSMPRRLTKLITKAVILEGKAVIYKERPSSTVWLGETTVTKRLQKRKQGVPKAGSPHQRCQSCKSPLRQPCCRPSSYIPIQDFTPPNTEQWTPSYSPKICRSRYTLQKPHEHLCPHWHPLGNAWVMWHKDSATSCRVI